MYISCVHKPYDTFSKSIYFKSFISSQSSNPRPVLLDLLGQLHLQGKGLYCTHDDSHNLALRDGLLGRQLTGRSLEPNRHVHKFLLPTHLIKCPCRFSPYNILIHFIILIPLQIRRLPWAKYLDTIRQTQRAFHTNYISDPKSLQNEKL